MEGGVRGAPPLWAWSIWRLLLFVILFGVLIVGLGLALGPTLRAAGTHARLLLDTSASLVAAIIAGMLLLRMCDKRVPGALGFGWTRGTLRELGLGFAIGAGALALAVALLVVPGFLRYVPQNGTALEYGRVLGRDLVVLSSAGAAEEAIFRGYPYQVLVQWLGGFRATLLASGAFAAAHLANPNVAWIGIANIFLAGVLLSVAYLRTRSLWFATSLHVGWNWAMASAFDLPVSGLDIFATPLYDPRLTGPEWLTGGAFGPEGGLVGTVAFGAALVAVLRLEAVRPAAEQLAWRPLVEEADLRAIEVKG